MIIYIGESTVTDKFSEVNEGKLWGKYMGNL